MLDAPTLTPWEQRSECERSMKRVRAVQRAHQQVGAQESADGCEERLNALLAVWRQLDAQCG